jgi:hypothetical protein
VTRPPPLKSEQDSTTASTVSEIVGSIGTCHYFV